MTPPAPLPLSLIVFAYNEAANIPSVLPEIVAWLRARGGRYDLVFVDDGSTDCGGDLARDILRGDPDARVLRHETNRGIGAAIKTAVRATTQPWVTFLPCDGQIAPHELDKLLRVAAGDGVRVVFSVYSDRDDGARRKLLSWGIRTLIRGAFGVSMRSDGPYLFARELFDADDLPPDTFFLNFEFPIKVIRAGHPHQVVTIHCRPRRAGVSKSVGMRRIAGVAADLVRLRFRPLPRRVPPR